MICTKSKNQRDPPISSQPTRPFTFAAQLHHYNRLLKAKFRPLFSENSIMNLSPVFFLLQQLCQLFLPNILKAADIQLAIILQFR